MDESTQAERRPISLTEFRDGTVKLEAGDESMHLTADEFAVLRQMVSDARVVPCAN